ncbi:MAG: formyltetrahydrofolate deformylase [Candidatus Sericytochromatia bacterium]|nr:formyltetrahydrofolate deformylase [Candidatus Sericytochromatia bacterium]
MNKYILLIDSNDEKGLVFNVTKILFENDLNIEKNNEFVDKENNKFFMRTEFTGSINLDEIKEKIKSVLPDNANIRLISPEKKNIILMCTKESHCLGDILIRYQANDLQANILAIISNHQSLENLVTKFEIPYFYISHENLTREEHEERVIKVIDNYNFDYLVLAKYMRVLTSTFTNKYSEKIINIHHSFLPAFIGANPYKQAYERGVKIIGATAHFVNDNLDEGPIIYQDVVTVDHSYGWKDMQKSGRDIEKIVLSKALNMALEDKIFINKNRTVIL